MLPAYLEPSRSLLDLIGQTPLLPLNRIDTGCCELYLKLENQNPSGSIKDRIARAMVDDAEKRSLLKPGGTMVEATAGNTGLALALIATQKNYKLILVVPDKMSPEKIYHLKAMGAEVILTRSDVVRGHPDYYQDKAEKIAASIEGAHFLNQFSNPANPKAHEEETAPELWLQMGYRIDAVVVGVGSGGTLTGLGRFFKRRAPRVDMILADPVGSILAPLIETGEMVRAGSWLVEGIGEDYVPNVCDLTLVKKAYSISDQESVQTTRLLLEREGIIAGSSTGTLLAAALRYCREQKQPKRVVSFVCDSGNKYLSRLYNPLWLEDHDLIQRNPSLDLRDLISRPYLRRDAVWASPHETLHQVYSKMRLHDLSAIPILNRDKLLGLIDEMDLLMRIRDRQEAFGETAGSLMRTKIETVEVSTPIPELLGRFESNRALCVMDQETFLGIITPIDLLTYLRNKMKRP